MTQREETEDASPKEVLTFHYSPNKYVFLGAVEIKDIPGALSRASAAVAELGLNLVWSSSFVIDPSGIAEWSFFAEAEGQAVSPEMVEKKLKQSGDVIDCKIRGEYGKLIVDTFHFPLRLNAKEDGMLLRKDVFADMLQYIVTTYGSAGKALAYQLGKTTGEADGRDLIRVLGRDGLIDNLPELTNLYMAQGWGIPHLSALTLDPISTTIMMEDCFECSNRVSSAPAANFIRGHLAGLGKSFFEKEVDCVETKCMAKGDQMCEFVASERLTSDLGRP